ncbi:MAG TPA: ATP-binding protein [Kiritimatiellia bacterium]|nr:ATP-binding protein [Kiritimatiellia bacterium]
MSIRIVLTGPESTGKSEITSHLAARLHVPFADELARTFLEKKGPLYDYNLLLELSRLHKSHQMEKVPNDAPLGIYDTDLINYKIWCEVVFGKCHPEIIETINSESNHIYLLCFPDIPWVYDPLREHPHDRELLFERHRQEIEKLNRPYAIIKGFGKTRFKNAESAIRDLIP